VHRGVRNRLAAGQFGGITAIVQEILQAVKYSRSLYSNVDLCFWNFVLFFWQNQMYNPKTKRNYSWL